MLLWEINYISIVCLFVFCCYKDSSYILGCYTSYAIQMRCGFLCMKIGRILLLLHLLICEMCFSRIYYTLCFVCCVLYALMSYDFLMCVYCVWELGLCNCLLFQLKLVCDTYIHKQMIHSLYSSSKKKLGTEETCRTGEGE